MQVTCNYPARRAGVTKLMTIEEARRKCPELILVCGEDLTPYREMSRCAQARTLTAATPCDL